MITIEGDFKQDFEGVLGNTSFEVTNPEAITDNSKIATIRQGLVDRFGSQLRKDEEVLLPLKGPLLAWAAATLRVGSMILLESDQPGDGETHYSIAGAIGGKTKFESIENSTLEIVSIAKYDKDKKGIWTPDYANPRSANFDRTIVEENLTADWQLPVSETISHSGNKAAPHLRHIYQLTILAFPQSDGFADLQTMQARGISPVQTADVLEENGKRKLLSAFSATYENRQAPSPTPEDTMILTTQNPSTEGGFTWNLVLKNDFLDREALDAGTITPVLANAVDATQRKINLLVARAHRYGDIEAMKRGAEATLIKQ